MDIDIYTTTTVATFNLEEQFKAKKKEHSDNIYIQYHRSNNISGSKVVHDLIMPSIVDG